MCLALKVMFLLIILNKSQGQDEPPLIEIPVDQNPSVEEPKIIDNSDQFADLRAQLEASQVVSQIHGTLKQLSETAQIRQQLDLAIHQNSYAYPGHEPPSTSPDDDIDPPPSFHLPPIPHGPPHFPVGFDLIKFLLGKAEQGNESSQTLGLVQSDEVGSVQGEDGDSYLRDFIRSSLKEVVKIPGDSEFDVTPNLVYSGFVKHLMGNGERAVAMSNSQYRESLNLVSVTEDPNFKLGSNVSTWYTDSFMNNKQQVLVGVSDRSLLLVLEQNGTFQPGEELLFDTPIVASTTFHRWNGNQMDRFVVLVTENEIQFVQVWAETEKIAIVWKWDMLRLIKVIFYFQIEDADSLLLVYDVPDPNGTQYSAYIYRFDLQSRHSWLMQKITLRTECASVHFLELGNEYVLVFPQNNTVEIFRYSRNSDSTTQTFEHLKSVESRDVKAVACFQIGGLSYISIGGWAPQILRYHRNQFVAQTIFSTNFGLVEHFLPIAARTYRDDLIVLVQHRVHFDGGHTVPALEALIWNGEAFVTAALAVPCYYKGVVVESGISCLLDYERDVGIEGASVIQRGNNISLLVPRFQAPSGLYFLAFHLDAKKDPSMVDDAHDAYRVLLELFNTQTDVTYSAKAALDFAVDSPAKFKADWSLGVLESEFVEIEVKTRLRYEQFWLGDQLLSADDLLVDVPRMLAVLEECSRDLDKLERSANSPSVPVNGQFKIENVRVLREKRESTPIVEQLYHIHIQNLQVKYINDIPVDEMVFTDDNGDIDLSESDLVIENDFTLGGEIYLKEDQLVEYALDQNLDSQCILHVTGNVNLKLINERDFNEFLRNVVMANIPNTLEHVVVEGNVQYTDKTNVGVLNKIAFPQGYVWNSTSGDALHITGKKIFTGELHTMEADIAGLLDGINTLDVVTLTAEQSVGGLTTFQQLEVNEHFDVTGKVSGRHLDDFLANPSLIDTQHIQTDCIFHTLIVEGPILVNNIQGVNLDEVLADVIYKNLAPSKITGFKSFDLIETEQFQLGSNQISGIPVDDFLTTNTEQQITVDNLSGNVIFRELSLNGLFDFVNVTELDERTIRLQGDQFTEAELIFQNPDGIGNDMEVNQLHILHFINDIPLENLVRLDGPLEINSDVEIDGIIVENMNHIEGEITGLGVLNEQPLGELERARVSLSRRQEIPAPFIIRKASIQGNLNAMLINGLPVVEIQKNMQGLKKVTQDLNEAHVVVQKMFIDGSVNVTHLNGHDFESIKSNAIWLDQPNTIRGILHFENTPEFVGHFIVDKVNGVPFNDLDSGVVRRNELQHVSFTHTQTFSNGFNVLRDLSALRIGGIDSANILSLKTGVINGLTVTGNVIAQSLNVAGQFNGIPVQDISQMYIFDELRQAHVIWTPVIRFPDHVIVDDLWLRPDSQNFTAFLTSVIRKDSTELTILKAAKEFQGPLRFLGDLNVGYVHGINVDKFLNSMVLNEAGIKATITGDASFENKVQATVIDVRGDIITDHLIGLDWSTWIASCIRIDQSYSMADTIYFGPDVFLSHNVDVINLNGIQISDVITTNTEQKFNQTAHFFSIISNANVKVGGLVNNLNLRNERANTIMTLGDQTISAESRFQSVRVLKSLQTLGPVSERNLESIVPLIGDQALTGPFSFSHISADDLQTNEHISGIDFNHWYQNALLLNKDVHIVNGNWTINELQAMHVDGSGSINGVDIRDFSERTLGQSQSFDEAILGAQQIQKDMCNTLKGVVQKSQSFKYTLAHFEDVFKITIVEGSINSLMIWQWDRHHYLLVNTGCSTTMYEFDSDKGIFEQKLVVDTGIVEEFLAAKDSINEIIVSNSGKLTKNCSRSGLHLWKWDSETLQLIKQISTGNDYELNRNQYMVEDNFFALHIKNRSVIEFDLTGQAIDEWKLPAAQEDCEDFGFVFLPDRITTELALSDGNHLSRLSPHKNTTSGRTKRCFGELCQNLKQAHKNVQPQLQNNLSQEKESLTNFTALSDKGIFNGLFHFKNHTKKQKESLLSNSTSIKLKMYKMNDPNITWPEWQLKGSNFFKTTKMHSKFEENELSSKLNDSSRTEQLGSTEYQTDVFRSAKSSTFESGTISELSENEMVGAAKNINSEKNINKGLYDAQEKNSLNPEYIVMATPSEMLDDSDTTFKESQSHPSFKSVNIIFPENVNDSRPASVEKSTTMGPENVSHPAINGSQPRMDLFGEIEKPAKKLTDLIFDHLYGKPSHSEIDIDNEDEDDDIETSSSANNTLGSKAEAGEMNVIIGTQKEEFSKVNGFNGNALTQKHKKTKVKIYELRTDSDSGISSEHTTTRINLVTPTHTTKGPESENKEIHLDRNSTQNTYMETKLGSSVKATKTSASTREITKSHGEIYQHPALVSNPNIKQVDSSSIQNNNAIATNNQDSSAIIQKPDNTTDAPPVGSVMDVVRDVVIAIRDGTDLVQDLRRISPNKYVGDTVFGVDHHHSDDYHIDDHYGTDNYYHEIGVARPEDETIIGVAVTNEGGVATSENHYLPGRVEGAEIVTFEVGEHRRTLVAISEWTKDVVRGHQDNIKIYEDVIDGRIFQTITCHRPRSLTTLRLRTDTVLAFIERDAELRLLVYRGIEGFTAFTAFTMDASVQQLQTIVLPPPKIHSFQRHLLVVVMAQEVRFLGAIMSGYCGLVVGLDCEG